MEIVFRPKLLDCLPAALSRAAILLPTLMGGEEDY